MDIRPIRTDDDHAAALAEIERLWGADPGTSEGDRLDVLAILVEAYEERRWPMDDPDPIEMINDVMEEAGYSQTDLAALIGSAARASEILNRKRALTRDMMWKLHQEWLIPAEVLIRPYDLKTSTKTRTELEKIRRTRAVQSIARDATTGRYIQNSEGDIKRLNIENAKPKKLIKK